MSLHSPFLVIASLPSIPITCTIAWCSDVVFDMVHTKIYLYGCHSLIPQNFEVLPPKKLSKAAPPHPRVVSPFAGGRPIFNIYRGVLYLRLGGRPGGLEGCCPSQVVSGTVICVVMQFASCHRYLRTVYAQHNKARKWQYKYCSAHFLPQNFSDFCSISCLLFWEA